MTLVGPHWNVYRGVPGRSAMRFTHEHTSNAMLCTSSVNQAQCGRPLYFQTPHLWHLVTFSIKIPTGWSALTSIQVKFPFQPLCASDLFWICEQQTIVDHMNGDNMVFV